MVSHASRNSDVKDLSGDWTATGSSNEASLKTKKTKPRILEEEMADVLFDLFEMSVLIPSTWLKQTNQ